MFDADLRIDFERYLMNKYPTSDPRNILARRRNGKYKNKGFQKQWEAIIGSFNVRLLRRLEESGKGFPLWEVLKDYFDRWFR